MSEIQLKIIIIGDSEVGKSAFLTQYLDNTFRDYNVSSLGMEQRNYKQKILTLNYNYGIQRDKKNIKALLQISLKLLKEQLLLLIQLKKNLLRIMWIRKLRIHASENMVKLLIGTKSDLVTEKIISDERISELCAENNNMKYFETSAKQNINIKESIHEIVSQLIDQVKPQENQVKKIGGNPSQSNKYCC